MSLFSADYNEVVLPPHYFQASAVLSVGSSPFCLPDDTAHLADLFEGLHANTVLPEIAKYDVCRIIRGL